MFPVKFSSDSLQICCMVSLYHTHQYLDVYKLIYFIIFLHFCVFITVFTCGLGKMLRFLIKSCLLLSSNQNHLKFVTWFHSIILINMVVFILYNFLHILVFLSLYLLRKMWPGKSVKVSD